MTEHTTLPTYYIFGPPPVFESIVEFSRTSRLAQLGDNEACLQVARCLLYGDVYTADQDQALAKQYLSEAHERGCVLATFYLGLLAEFIDGVPSESEDDIRTAIDYYAHAVTHNLPRAGYHLYNFSLTPEYRDWVPFTDEELDIMFEMAVEATYAPALYMKAIALLTVAENQSYPQAVLMLKESDKFDPPPAPKRQTNILQFAAPRATTK